MVKVATRPADNPVGAMARKLHIGKDTWGKKKFNSTISQRFVTSTGNMEVLLYNAHSIVCASAYFDPKKYSLMPKLTFFSVQMLQGAETLIYIFFSQHDKNTLKSRI